MSKQKTRIQLSAKKVFIERDVLETILFTNAVNPLEFSRAFEKVGIKIKTKGDLVSLANIQAMGQDKKGYRGPDGRIHAFDTEMIVRSVPVNKALFLSAPIDWHDMVVEGQKIKII